MGFQKPQLKLGHSNLVVENKHENSSMMLLNPSREEERLIYPPPLTLCVPKCLLLTVLFFSPPLLHPSFALPFFSASLSISLPPARLHSIMVGVRLLVFHFQSLHFFRATFLSELF